MMKHWLLLGSILFVALATGCTYHNEATLYPETPNDCDTVQVSFQNVIRPWLDLHCTSCHEGSTPRGNVSLDSYADVVRWAADGSLYGSSAHLPGFSPMPKNEPIRPDCELNQLRAWINSGTPNN